MPPEYDGSAKARYDGINVFSETDFNEDLKFIDVPTLVTHGDDDQMIPIGHLLFFRASL